MKNPFSKKRDDLINSLQDQSERLIKSLQVTFEDSIVEYFEANLTVSDGMIMSSTSNYSAISSLDSLKNSFREKSILPFVKTFSKGLIKLLFLNKSYFKFYEDNFGERKLNKRIEGSLLNELGISRSGARFSFKRGGWISDLSKVDEPYKEIKRRAIRAARSGVSLTAFRKDIKKYIKGGGKMGVLEGHFNTHVTDAYSQFDRKASEEFAIELDYSAAIYEGGVIKTTRPFCKERNGKVYTREEMRAWKQLDFKGKPDNYDPERDAGGYNCRHFYSWIPDALAIQLRPDLKSYFQNKLNAA